MTLLNLTSTVGEVSILHKNSHRKRNFGERCYNSKNDEHTGPVHNVSCFTSGLTNLLQYSNRKRQFGKQSYLNVVYLMIIQDINN